MRPTVAESIGRVATARRSRVAAAVMGLLVFVGNGNVEPVSKPGFRPLPATLQCTQKIGIQNSRIEREAAVRPLMRHEAGVALARRPRTDLADGDAELGHSVAGQVVEFLSVAVGEVLGVVSGVQRGGARSFEQGNRGGVGRN